MWHMHIQTKMCNFKQALPQVHTQMFFNLHIFWYFGYFCIIPFLLFLVIGSSFFPSYFNSAAHLVFLHESWLFPAFLAPLEGNLSVAFVLCFQRGWDSSIVFLFDKSLTKYSGPLTARPLPDSVNFIGEIYICVSASFFCLYKWSLPASGVFYDHRK